MTITRSKSGHTPKRPSNPDFVETPGRSGRGRKVTSSADKHLRRKSSREFAANGQINGSADGKASRSSSVKRRAPSQKRSRSTSTSRTRASHAHKMDKSGEFEFGGTPGAIGIIIFSHLIMYYMFIGATFYNGKLPTPARGESWSSFAKHMLRLVYYGAFPTFEAWAIYWVFFIVQAAFYVYMPFGVYAWGKPLQHLGGKKLQYYCSGVPSFYTSIVVALGLHFSGSYRLDKLIDLWGPIMSVAVLSGDLVAIIAYFSALYRGAEHRMSGYPVYDFFMGAELNPRMLKWLDFKMFCEVRVPWFILFFTTLAASLRQYEQYGYVSGELGLLLMAHWLYANACCKAEQLIPPTWDMYYEKWGWMLVFWNLAGVPFSYCQGSIYLSLRDPATYRMNRAALAFLYASYLFAYWVWDTAGSQKNYFRAKQRGTIVDRKTFPQLPFRYVENPVTIPVPSGDDLLCDGWYKYARKIHYTSDMWFAFCWAVVCGFDSPFPWFYPVFFFFMILHRASRDIARCRERYGKAWEEYERRVPYLFIPYVF